MGRGDGRLPLDHAVEASASVSTEELSEDELSGDEKICTTCRFLGQPGVTAEQLAPRILATYQALNEYTLAKYGKPLRLAKFKRLVLTFAGAPKR